MAASAATVATAPAAVRNSGRLIAAEHAAAEPTGQTRRCCGARRK
jgi:hypothetical protein